MEEKEVRIPILGVIDENELECREDLHFFETYPNGKGVYLMKNTGISIALRNVYKSSEKNKDGKEFALWTDFPIPMNIAIEDIKKEQETQLKEALAMVSDRLVATATDNNKLTTTLSESLNSLHDDVHNNVIGRLQSIEETLKQLTEAHAQLTENGSTSGSGITEKTLLEALAIVTKKV